MTPGRNAPCPCGSGKKYKHCCIDRDRPAYTQHDRVAALTALESFLESPEFDDMVEDELDDLQSEALADLPMEAAEEIVALRTYNDAPLFFLGFDLALDDERSLAQIFIAGDGAHLPAGQRTYLTRMSETPMALYEIVAVRSDEGLDLRDARTGKLIAVKEIGGSREVLPGEGLGVRVIEGPTGALEIEPPVYRFSPADLHDVAQNLAAERLRLDRRRKPEIVARRERLHHEFVAGLLHAHWIRATGARLGPPPVVVDGARMLFTRAIFDVLDEARVAPALLGDDRILADGGDGRKWIWVSKQQPPASVLASIHLEGGRLIAESISEERAAAARSMLESRLGDAVRYRVTELEDPMQALRAAQTATPPLRRSEDLPAEAHDIVVGFLAKHYDRWVDIALPALDGHTPREAALHPRLKPRLIALLRDFDITSERQRRAGDATAFDFTPIWAALGLTGERLPGEPSPQQGNEPHAAQSQQPRAAASPKRKRSAGRPGAIDVSAPDLLELSRLLDQRATWTLCMDLSMLDGFLCAVASAPSHIPEEQWLGKVLGTDAPSLFSAPPDDDRLVTLLRNHAHDMVRRLDGREFEPIVDRRRRPGLWSIAAPWCAGYGYAIGLRQSAWDRFSQKDEHAGFLVPIVGLAIPPDRKDLHPPSSRDRRSFERCLAAAAQMVYNAVKHPDEVRAIGDVVKRTIEPTRAEAPARTVHRLQISLRDVRPRVWRRLEIASDVKLPQLSRALLAAMGWTDSHLHQFVVGRAYYGIPDPDFPRGMRSERSVTLARIAPEPKDRVLFEYDFGDGWRHTVTVEAVVEPEPSASYPRCTGGARACPPEDCGGPFGYEELLATLADPSHDDYSSMLEWVGGSFDPEAFSVDDANAALRPMRRKIR